MESDATAPVCCLVNMPSAAPERPSIALGMLQAILTGAGVPTRTLHANLWFLDFIGLSELKLLDSFRTEEAVVDWCFGAAAFPDFAPDHELFLRRLVERNVRSSEASVPPQMRERLLAVRTQTPAFIDWVASRVLALRPRIVGCTSTFQQHVASLALLRRVKQLAPEIVTVIGGANCESVMGLTTHREFPWIDYVVSGEADEFIVPLFRLMLQHGAGILADALPFGVFAPCHRTLGYPRTDKGDGVPRALTADIRDLPLPDYADYFADVGKSTYARAISAGLPMEFSRGCWWGERSHCTFCGLNGGSMSFRAKPAADVADAMRTMVARYGSRRIEVVDNIMDLSYFSTVLPDLAERQEGLSVFFETKSNLKRHQVALLAAAGVRWIQPGIESLHSGVLSLMRKGVSAWTNIQLLKWARHYGVRVSWSIICNFPGEDDAWYTDMAEFIPALAHLQPGPAVTLRFDRYSPYFTDPNRWGLKLQPSELYCFAYPLPPDVLADQVYFFEDVPAPDECRQLNGPEGRPGLTAVRLAMRAWVRAWRQDAIPALLLQEEGDILIVTDTRPCATEPSLSLGGAARAALLAAEEAPPETRLRETLRAAMSETELDAALRFLLDRRLVLRLDGRIIGLPIRPPVRPIPGQHAFPGGHLMEEDNELIRLLKTMQRSGQPAPQ